MSEAVEPPSDANLGGLLLLLDVMEQQGRSVTILDRSWWTKNKAAGHAADLDGVDYIVVEDSTWHAWKAYCDGG